MTQGLLQLCSEQKWQIIYYCSRGRGSLTFICMSYRVTVAPAELLDQVHKEVAFTPQITQYTKLNVLINCLSAVKMIINNGRKHKDLNGPPSLLALSWFFLSLLYSLSRILAMSARLSGNSNPQISNCPKTNVFKSPNHILLDSAGQCNFTIITSDFLSPAFKTLSLSVSLSLHHSLCLSPSL